MEVGAATSVGKIRTNNEDAYWVGEGCFVVCDGMGGQQAGEVAASLAIDTVRSYCFTRQNPQEELKEVINKAHERISSQALGNEGFAGMGTTITMAIVVPSESSLELVIGHVGDSRAYLVRDNNMEQLTDDHSVVGELMRTGSLTEVEATNHPQRHVLIQALGAGNISIDISAIPVREGDMLLLCTDGLFGIVDHQTIVDTLKGASPQDAADQLIASANRLGGPDNVTVVIVHF